MRAAWELNNELRRFRPTVRMQGWRLEWDMLQPPKANIPKHCTHKRKQHVQFA